MSFEATGDDVRRSALADRLTSATLRLVRRIRQEDHALGETPARLSVISTLINRGPTTLTDLAEIERVRPPTLTRLVQALERDGHVVRRRARHDGRVWVVTTTSNAWKLLQDASGRRVGVLRSGLRTLQPDEIRVLEEAAVLLERLAADETTRR
jgi:DNA-binding MarR family transcriptional regulator